MSKAKRNTLEFIIFVALMFIIFSLAYVGKAKREKGFKSLKIDSVQPEQVIYTNTDNYHKKGKN